MDLNLTKKKAVVCAASKGLGRAVAEALAGEGCDLFICSRNKSQIEKAAAELRSSYGVNVQSLAVDLATLDGCETLLKEIATNFSDPDILVNNIGGPPPSPAADTTPDQWQKGFEQIFMSSTVLTQRLLPGMRSRKYGRIITITSLSVVEPIEHLVVSTAMRSAVTAFSKTLASEVAADGVTVNTVMPGVIHTQRIEKLREAKAERDGTSLEKEMEATKARIPARRLGQPEELASLVTFLASPLAGYMTGCNLPVDGGLRKGL